MTGIIPHGSVGAHWAPWYWPGMHWIAHMTTDSCAQNNCVPLTFTLEKHGSHVLVFGLVLALLTGAQILMPQ
jgi:hypothetical protein